MLIEISIHALREEGDALTAAGDVVGVISIHALREEGDEVVNLQTKGREHFYPRPPRGGRRLATLGATPVVHISIHALREEGDTLTVSARMPSIYFYPRPPRGGRLDLPDEFGVPGLFLSTPSARRAT